MLWLESTARTTPKRAAPRPLAGTMCTPVTGLPSSVTAIWLALSGWAWGSVRTHDLTGKAGLVAGRWIPTPPDARAWPTVAANAMRSTTRVSRFNGSLRCGALLERRQLRSSEQAERKVYAALLELAQEERAEAGRGQLSDDDPVGVHFFELEREQILES